MFSVKLRPHCLQALALLHLSLSLGDKTSRALACDDSHESLACNVCVLTHTEALDHEQIHQREVTDVTSDALSNSPLRGMLFTTLEQKCPVNFR